MGNPKVFINVMENYKSDNKIIINFTGKPKYHYFYREN